MYNYLVDHALRNVWCDPEQDKQFIFKAKRISRPLGELNRFRLMNRALRLPVQGKRYAVYQIGQVPPSVLGLLPKKVLWSNEEWINFETVSVQEKVILNLYTKEGSSLPLYNTYYMFTNERDLIFIVELDNNVLVDYLTDHIYFRLYSNAFYSTVEASSGVFPVEVKGGVIRNSDDLLQYQSEIAQRRLLPGYVFCYVNGFLTKDISPVSASIGDSVQYVYDSSVKKIVTFNVRDLQTFVSTLDNKTKYLLHYLDTDNSEIDFHDDIDIYVVHNHNANRYQGHYYHRNAQDSHRMVTHKDYSVCVEYFDYIADELIRDMDLGPLDKRDFQIMLTIRNSGYTRPLIYDNQRIFELYKLDPDKLLQAMVGINALEGLWDAATLENSAYVELMRSSYADVNIDLVQRAYGYNGMSKVVGSTPTKTRTESGRQVVDLAYGTQNYSTCYEYDIDGKLINFYHHVNGTNYEAVNNHCHLVETLVGKGTHQPYTLFGQDNINLPLIDNYRVYRCFLNTDGLPNENWQDVTGSNEYRVENNVLIHNSEQYDHFYMVRTDRDFLAYETTISSVNSNLFFSITEQQDRGNGVQTFLMPVPAGELDVWINGHSGIKGLDYIVKFPVVYIISKRFLNFPVAGSIQRIGVRFTGFCQSDLSFDPIDDFGFIEHSYLSNNNRFDIRDDKVLRITIDGKLYHRSELEFSEEHDGVSVIDVDNGRPYQVKDIIVPLKQLVVENTYSLRDKSLVIDKMVSDYMTIKKPQYPRNAPNAIPQRYPLVSPFINRIVFELENDYISDSQILNFTSDNEILTFLSQYAELLDYDPIQKDLDERYVLIHPHVENTVKSLSVTKYQFLQKVLKLYANDLVTLDNFISVA